MRFNVQEAYRKKLKAQTVNMKLKIPQREPEPKKPDFKTESKAIIFDLESVAQNEERLLALAPAFEAPASWKDPEKIKAKIEQQRQDYLAEAALNWKTAEIPMIGIHDGMTYAPLLGTEKEIITKFFGIVTQALENQIFVGGHNIFSFDLPMIINRARVNRIEVPTQLCWFNAKGAYWNEWLFDTCVILAFSSSLADKKGNGVDDACRAFGIQGKTGDGSMFGSLWKSDRNAAIAYNRADCEAEVEIAKLCGFKFQ